MVSLRKSAHEIDQKVGQRLHLLRVSRGATQAEVADHLYLSYQQLHKYEKGTNRISVGRLYQLAQLFDVPIGYFFDDEWESGDLPVFNGMFTERMFLEFARSFRAIRDDKCRAALAMMARLLARATEDA